MARTTAFAAALLLLVSGLATSFAQRNSGGSPDPFNLNEDLISVPLGAVNIPLRTTVGRTLAAVQGVDTSVRNLILIAAGQSNNANITPTDYTVMNPTKIDNLNIYDGAIYTYSNFMTGASGSLFQGLPASITADLLIQNNKFDRVIIMPVAINGSFVANWGTGGILSNRIPVAMARLKQRGIVPGMTNVTFAIQWGQGESDQGTSQADYTTAWNQMYAIAAASGFVGRWFVAKQTYFNGSFGAGAQAAQTANSPSGVINHANGVWAGAIADSLVGSICSGTFNQACRVNDPTNDHWSLAGAISYAFDPTFGWIPAMAASGAPF